jgi:hypothetical protein
MVTVTHNSTDRLQRTLDYIKKVRSKPDKKKPNSGFIYLIQCHDFVKVGYAKDVATRLSSLQTGCPYELHLLASWPTEHMEHDENRLHNLWRKFEVRGEWFQVPEGELICVMNAEKFENIFNV